MADHKTDEKLFAAFMAGFDSSGEGFNGEYVGSRYRPRAELEKRLREDFEHWLRTGEVVA